MKGCARGYNIILALAAALALFCGCQTHKQKGPVAALRVHIQTTANTLGTSQTINVVRSDPVMVTIATTPILTEANVATAQLVDTPGGFAIAIQFDENGTWLLEQYSASNPGSHLAIYGQWGDTLANGRWLAAPLISHRIANGLLSFTPDASRAEADQFVTGLTNTIAAIHKGDMK